MFRRFSHLVQVNRHGIFVPKQSMSTDLLDTFGRKHDYLRISLTEKCNLRCLYCMPEEGVQLTPSERLLSTEELFRLSNMFVARFGVKKIRLTGGEPLIRKDIIDIVSHLNGLKKQGLEQIGITTNGIVFARHCEQLCDAGLDSVNISLDTLNPERFLQITRRNGFKQVQKSIAKALEQPDLNVKINFVPIQNLNENEVVDFVEMTREKRLEVRFIEYMPFDGNRWSWEKMVSYKQLLSQIVKHFGESNVKPVAPKSPNETSRMYRVDGFTGTFGFISSMTNAFCSSCNRIRITADGNLKVCLFGKEEVSLKDALRSGSTDEQLCQLVVDSVKAKKKQHAGAFNIAKSNNRPMILIARQPRVSQIRALSSKPPEFSHIDPTSGESKMVNVGSKRISKRMAHARCRVILGEEVIQLIQQDKMAKGDVLSVARIGGILGAKWTSHLIPLCHQIPLDHVEVKFQLEKDSVVVDSWVRAEFKTGVEMEALTAASIAALTIYDMCKAVNKRIRITECRLVEKTGGKSDFKED